MTRTLDILDRLIAFDTVSANSNLALADYAEPLLTRCGFSVVRIADGSGAKAGLYAEKGPEGAGVLLSAHTDVVPAAGQTWTRPPFRLTREGDRLFGRGTTDMKGFVASVLALAERASATDLGEPLRIVLSYDEEVGCTGIREMLDRLQPLLGRPRACIVGEPTEMAVAIGHKGKAALRATCHGQGGHSALAPRFVNALHMAADFMTELRALQDDLARTGARDAAYDIPYSTVHVGKLDGGTALNIVPDMATLDLEYRHLAADASDGVLARIITAGDQVAAQYRAAFDGARIEVERYNAYPGLDVPAGTEVVTYVKGLARTNTVTKVAFGTEAGYFHQLGIPTVVCGPGSMEAQGHKPDEFVTLAQLAACDAMMDRLLADLTR